MLDGEEGQAVADAMKLIVSVGEALGAERLVEVEHVHVSGISYNNIGDYGLEWIEKLYENGGRARVFSTFNPAGTCFCIDAPVNRRHIVYKQAKIVKYLLRMGFQYTSTCIPYEARRPSPGEHLAWGESSAVAVANSLYAARTNREGGPLSLAAAITGRTYYWGLHIEENRKPTVHVQIGLEELGEVDAGLVGYIIGEKLGGEIAYIDFEKPLERRSAIELCAAAAASGSIAHCVIKNLSPEDSGPPSSVERIEVDYRDIETARAEIETGDLSEASVFFTGCPHLAPSEARRVFETALKYSQKLKPGRREVWIAVPASLTRDTYWQKLYMKGIRHGIRLLFGTCIVVADQNSIPKRIATDSVKTAFYLSRRGVSVALASLEQFLNQ